MKKLFALGLIVALTLSFAACGDKKDEKPEKELEEKEIVQDVEAKTTNPVVPPNDNPEEPMEVTDDGIEFGYDPNDNYEEPMEITDDGIQFGYDPSTDPNYDENDQDFPGNDYDYKNAPDGMENPTPGA